MVFIRLGWEQNYTDECQIQFFFHMGWVIQLNLVATYEIKTKLPQQIGNKIIMCKHKINQRTKP